MILQWQQLYQAALLEVRPEQLRQSMATAEKAMEQRLEELKPSDPGSSDEQRAIADALRRLRVLADSECSASRTGDSDEVAS
jgi:hypothetical protein